MNIAPSPTVIRVKLAVLNGIERAIISNYGNYYRAACELNFNNPSKIYQIKKRLHDRYSLPWLIDLAERLGAEVSITIETSRTGTSCQTSPSSLRM